MKFLLVLTAAIIASLPLNAQSNNPKDQVGLDFVSSLTTVKDDIAAGRVSDLDESTFASYNRSLPIGQGIDFEAVVDVLTRLKSSSLSFQNILDSTSLSPLSKSILLQVVKNPNGLNNQDYMDDLVLKVDTLNNSALSVDEKNFVLSLVAVAYHIVHADVATTFNTRTKNGCFVSSQSPDGTTTTGPADCSVFGAVAGGVIGFLICSWPCGLGGAVIGGLLGSLS